MHNILCSVRPFLLNSLHQKQYFQPLSQQVYTRQNPSKAVLERRIGTAFRSFEIMHTLNIERLNGI